MRVRRWLGGMTCLVAWTVCLGQKTTSRDEQFSRRNGWTIFAEYSNTSSHLLMGASRQRELVTLGGAYTRRLGQFRGTELSYQAEVRPAVFESDPLAITTTVYSGGGAIPVTFFESQATVFACTPASGSYPIVGPDGLGTGTYQTVCGRQWTFAQSFSPLGFKYSLMRGHRVQPFFIGTLGYMYSSRPIPVGPAESFNFAFDFGPGIDLYRTARRSVSLECRFHHFSNRNTAQENPGVDNLMYKVSYSFGR